MYDTYMSNTAKLGATHSSIETAQREEKLCKMFFCAALVILMIIKFRFPKGKTIHQVIERRYGRPLHNLFRKLENFDLKIRKSLCDIEFLNVCLENELTPKFLNFKLYRKDLRNTSQFQQKLLDNELFDKTKKLKKLRSDFKNCIDQLKSLVSFLDFSHLLNFIRNVNDKKIKKIKKIKNRKVFSLGLEHEITRLNPHDLIFNYSNRILSDEEIEALSHGLKFGLSTKKIDYSQWFLSFEKLFSKLKSCEIFASSKDELNFFKTSLKTLAFKTFYSFRPWSSVLEKQFIATLYILKKNSYIYLYIYKKLSPK